MKKLLSFFTLFSSASTLICCAIPALLVSLSLGASLASLLGQFPQLIWVSEHKAGVFLFAGIMLTLAVLSRSQAQRLSCPVDERLGEACREARSLSRIVLPISVAMYLTGLFFSYVAPRLFG